MSAALNESDETIRKRLSGREPTPHLQCEESCFVQPNALRTMGGCTSRKCEKLPDIAIAVKKIEVTSQVTTSIVVGPLCCGPHTESPRPPLYLLTSRLWWV